MKSTTKTSVPWLSARAAAVHLGYTDAAGVPQMGAFYTFLCRRRKDGRPVKASRLGGLLRFRQVDLDAAVEPEPVLVEPTQLLRMVQGGVR